MAVTMDMAELAESRDVDLGVSDWLEVTQSMIDGFADATLDTEPKGGGLRCRIEVTVEIEGQDRPAVVATTFSLRYVA